MRDADRRELDRETVYQPIWLEAPRFEPQPPPDVEENEKENERVIVIDI